MIVSFRGDFYFLSNFYHCKVTYNGITYGNNEAAFQAQKQLSRSKEFEHLPPNSAKRLGRRVKLREDWEEVKDQIMYEIVKCKFTQNLDLKQKLLDTNDEELIEGNNWNDRYWGMVFKEHTGWIGENKLGKILMRVREEIKEDNK